MNKSRSRICFVSLAMWLVLSGVSSPLAAQTTHDITVGDNFFSPANLTIQVGDTVRWNNAAGGRNHNVTANDGSFASATSSSFTFSQTFTSAGAVDYRCTLHPSQMNGTITVQGGGGPEPADLSLETVNADAGTFAPGDDIDIDISIKNIGGETSPVASITYYASTNSGISASDTELGTDAVTALAADATRNYTATATFPEDIAAGTYFIGAIIDVNDANAGNNANVDNGTITIATPVPFVDLALQTINAPAGAFEQGASFAVSTITENLGDLASDPYQLTLYASTDSQVTTGDSVIGAFNRGGLAEGAEDSFSPQVMLPAMLAPGNYFIGGIIDIDDADNSNNSKVDNGPITVIEPANGFLINEGLNDAWYNPATAGQGVFITVFRDIQMMFLAWFTYDTQRPANGIEAILGEPGHRWLTAFGPYTGNTATLDVELTQGGVFDSMVPAVMQSADGSIEVIFSGCNAGMINYDITSAGVSGQVPIERIALDNVPFCETQAAAQ